MTLLSESAVCSSSPGTFQFLASQLLTSHNDCKAETRDFRFGRKPTTRYVNEPIS